ncbi:MAG TPA: phosphatase PAP2 family protein [Candidatus Paceibacterota bacterium]
MVLDSRIVSVLNDWAGNSVFAKLFAFLANYSIIIFLIVFVLYLFYHPELRHRTFLVYTFISAFISRGIFGTVLKNLFARPRPSIALTSVHALISEAGYSMPSGHALVFFTLATCIYMRDKRWGAWMFGLATFFSLTRVLVGAHYMSDILVGAVLGIAIAFIMMRIMRKNYAS